MREGGDELAARRAAVAVLHGEAHVAHVEVERVAVEHEHERGQPISMSEARRGRAGSGAAPSRRRPQRLTAPHAARPARRLAPRRGG